MLNINDYKKSLSAIYGDHGSVIHAQLKRYQSLIQTYNSQFKEEDLHLFSTPGRTEIAETIPITITEGF